MMLALDYTRWGNARHVWNSTADLLAAPSIADGVHSIQAEGLPLDVLMVNGACLGKATQTVLPVFFSGAVSNRGGKPGPFFSGSGIAESKGIAAICIADPTLALDPDLGLAWYAGSSRQQTQACVLELLAGLADKFQIELLLVGGSGAGFAALQFGGKLRERASVLVWNPQTDLLAYYRNAVKTYLRSAFPDEAWEDDPRLTSAGATMRGKGISHAVHLDYAAGQLPRRLVYLQNASDDFHVLNHAGSLLAGMTVEANEGRYRTADERTLFWFGDWAQGHEPIPKRTLCALIDLMLDPANSIEAISHNLGALDEAGGGVSGLPLSFRHAANRANLGVRAALTDVATLKVSAAVEGVPSGLGSARFAFYVFSGGERIQVRWYESASEAEFPLLPGKPPTRVAAFAMDSFGQKTKATTPVGSAHARTLGSPAAHDPNVLSNQPCPPSVFVLGSCVSRDAFALVETDITLVRYVARTSLASAFHRTPAPAHMLSALTSMDSEWQRRMVEIDLARKLPAMLRSTQFDVVLVDLIDERFPLLMLDDVPVTASTEFKKAGFPEGRGQSLGYASGARMQLWLQGVRRLMATVDPGKIIINRVYWASRTASGELLEDQDSIRAHNEMLGKMYARLASCHPFATIDYPPHLLVADENHRWGLSPFHYAPRMYEHTMERLRDLAEASHGLRII
ncbi:DUF6270 domain-containing protein [Novilysobacter erysipheiresistens]|uniref:DUF6270 domain-containing protein n=1 Tax=Novilysobacter erysipheiresistens TaxID=1749332 RepID=A0ABU7YZ24_9GAMM